ncbi:hypothetical protein HaLaN_05123 [Haematococcus lacustris]|uniref:Uncharacterized protein n=1 Tax=Haematococcus lacustris TaxID=44745 RepID=A0A699YI76_HAELA|nr:hypothetical protein HaLaN_05123 [Haematococcus lacustris]
MANRPPRPKQGTPAHSPLRHDRVAGPFRTCVLLLSSTGDSCKIKCLKSGELCGSCMRVGGKPMKRLLPLASAFQHRTGITAQRAFVSTEVPSSRLGSEQTSTRGLSPEELIKDVASKLVHNKDLRVDDDTTEETGIVPQLARQQELGLQLLLAKRRLYMRSTVLSRKPAGMSLQQLLVEANKVHQ